MKHRWSVPAVAAALLFVGASAVAGADSPKVAKIRLELKTVPFQAAFHLSIDDAGHAEVSSGQVFIRHDGIICLAVDAPVHQRLSFGQRQLTIYYPDDKTLFVSRPRPGQLPVMIDALYLGLVDPAGLLTKSAKVLEQTQDAATHTLTTVWQVADPSGHIEARIRAVEAREGTRAIDLLSKDGTLRRHYQFDDRVTLGTASIPGRISVTYKKTPKPDRVDSWTLDGVRKEDDRSPASATCVEVPPSIPAHELKL